LRRSCAIVVSFRSALIVTIALEGFCPRLFYMSWWSLCSMDHPSAGRELTSIYRSDFAAINGPVSRDRAQLPVWGLSRLVSHWTPQFGLPYSGQPSSRPCHDGALGTCVTLGSTRLPNRRSVARSDPNLQRRRELGRRVTGA
jgi:hypothetical protein